METQSAIRNYLKWKASYTSRAAEVYEIHLERFKKFIPEQIEKIKIGQIIKFQTSLARKYSPSHVALAIIVVKNFLDFWSRQGVNCPDSSLIHYQRFSPNSYPPITEEEFQKIDNSLGENEFYELQKKLIVNFLHDTGVRVSELCDLKLSDIDTQIRKSQIKTKKNGNLDWIMWSEKTHYLLLKYLGIRICLNSQQSLWVTHRNRHASKVSSRTIQRWIKDIFKRVGIVGKSVHSFRHGKAHQILRLGGNVKHVQAILRHSESNPITSFNYLHLSSDEFDKIATRFLG